MLVGCPRDCYDTCRLRVYVENGKMSRIEAVKDRLTQGMLCPRAAKDVERVYSSLRILYPVINIGGVFRKIEWDRALETLVHQLSYTLEKWGPEKVLFLEYAGNRGILTRYASRRLWNFLGVARTDGSMCDYSGAKALRLVYGSTYGVFPSDIEKLRTVLIWGFNPAVSAIHLWAKVLGVKDRGGRIITIDARLSETARQSTDFVLVKPGSDGYLALGMARYLLDRGYIDTDFAKKYVYGFESFLEHVKRYDLDKVERVTGVPKSKVAELAESIALGKPFAILIGYGLQRRRGGGEIVRAISALPALLGIHRGFYYSNTDGLPINLAAVDGSDRWGPRKIVSMEKVGEELARGEYRFVYIHLHNPVATLPQAEKVVEGIKRNDVFVVVHETHWTDTAKVADLVLPAPTFYEKLDAVFSYLHNIVYLNKPVIDPLGESIGEYQLMCEVAKRLTPSSYSDICADPDEILVHAFGRENAEKLLKNGYVELDPMPRDVYQTPTGKIELYSTIAAKEGLPPVPTPPEGDSAEEDELILISSAHPLYIHTQFEDVYGPNQGEMYISPEDAQKRGISSGDVVEVFNKRGSVVMRIRVDSSLTKGVAWAPRQAYTLDGKRINVLVDDDVDVYGGATINSTRIRIRKLA